MQDKQDKSKPAKPPVKVKARRPPPPPVEPEDDELAEQGDFAELPEMERPDVGAYPSRRGAPAVRYEERFDAQRAISDLMRGAKDLTPEQLVNVRATLNGLGAGLGTKYLANLFGETIGGVAGTLLADIIGRQLFPKSIPTAPQNLPWDEE